MEKKSGHYHKKVPVGLRKWLKFEKFGTLITYETEIGSQDSIKLVPFKCPLGDDHDISIPKPKRLYPEDLFGHYYRNGMVLKFVIDLSNTEKYYDPESFENVGVKHHKMPIAGQVIPNDAFIKDFFSLVENMEQQLAPNEYIGVHCTHGVNRTGYMIVRYLVEQRGVKIDEALKAFNQSRQPHELNEECLLEDLQQRYKQ